VAAQPGGGADYGDHTGQHGRDGEWRAKGMAGLQPAGPGRPGGGSGETEDANREVTTPRAAGRSWVAEVWKVEWNSANETPSRALAASIVHIVWAVAAVR
jgi:hypothetical protein